MEPPSYKEANGKRADVNINMEQQSFDITSEEDTGSDCDSEVRTRVIPVQQIWNPDVLWAELQVN